MFGGQARKLRLLGPDGFLLCLTPNSSALNVAGVDPLGRVLP